MSIRNSGERVLLLPLVLTPSVHLTSFSLQPKLRRSGAVALQLHHVENDRVVDHAVQRGHRGEWIFENALPVRKDEVGRDSHRSTFVAFGTLTNIRQSSVIHSANSFRSRRSTPRSRARCFP